MFPYANAFRWVVRPRQRHLVDALGDDPASFMGEMGEELQKRVRGLLFFLKVRTVLLVLIWFSVVVSAISWLLRLFGGIDRLEAVLGTIAGWTLAAAGLWSLLYLLTLRTLAQLEIDAILLLPSHRSRWAALGEGGIHSVAMTDARPGGSGGVAEGGEDRGDAAAQRGVRRRRHHPVKG